MGQKWLGKIMNENIERFADLCATSNLFIGSDMSRENQINYIGIKFHRSLQDALKTKSRRCFGPSSPCRPIETEIEDELNKAGPSNISVKIPLNNCQ
ncbi:hypothetical protein DPMN_113724 [Dreissena polymorpha]|uniref:Uncharacterized protein n=1 Tax=Dreissena polymorpha TaxID=45954 RepID=A0A9D4KHX3_DREPO|nr:hypothetical protein DPMN_113724 [Dreissena polymorpha]